MDYLHSIFERYCKGAGSLKIVDGIDDFKAFATRLDVLGEEIEKYQDDLSGLIIKEHETDEDFIILLRKEIPEEIKDKTIHKLKNLGVDPPLDLYSDDKNYVHAFVLLHEIAHYVLSHGSTNEKEEREANIWAAREFPYNLETIRAQQSGVV